MDAIKVVISVVIFLVLGSFLLRESLHIDSPKEKMSKATARPAFRHYPKWYLALVGATAICAALYFAWRFLLSKLL